MSKDERRIELQVVGNDATGALQLRHDDGGVATSRCLADAGFKDGDRVLLVPAPAPPVEVKCRCGAPIVVLPTGAGLQMPVDAETVQAGDVRVDVQKHRSHFVTCTATENKPEDKRG